MMQENAQTEENTPAPENLITFADLGLNKDILRSVEQAGFVTPSPIQAAAIPLVLQGRDIVGQAHTGTGKTAAFGLPALNNIDVRNGVEILVITPTRELAIQTSN
jgi:ATP-dependent RNA helicase DeaD